MNQSGIIFDIQRSALNDGPGIRTTVFLKGCPLRCKWCHNPESWDPKPEVNSNGKQYGQAMTVEEIMEVVRLDKAYYQHSGGGLTISGGEPLMQPEFTIALLEAAKEEGIHTCLDTSGFADGAIFEALVPLVDVFHFDYKVTDARQHRNLTGVSNKQILENLEYLIRSDARIILRCPMIPDVNDTQFHLQAIRKWAETFPDQIVQVDLLPYHPTGFHKYHDLGMETDATPFKTPTEEQISLWITAVQVPPIQAP